MEKMTEAQKCVMKWIGKGWTAYPAGGTSIQINGNRGYRLATMTALYDRGLAKKNDDGSWDATESGRMITEQLEL